MKAKLATRVLDRYALRELLATCEIIESHAAAGATVYRVRHHGHEDIVTTLPEGGALRVSIESPMPAERRLRRPRG